MNERLATNSELREYCWEAFNANCSSSHNDYHHRQSSHSDLQQNHHLTNHTTPTTQPTGRMVEDSVILLTQAFYGRMRKHQCIKTDNDIGCHRDVLTYMDRFCSGRSSCSVPVPNAEMHMMQPCNADMMAYLEAEYSCVKGGWVGGWVFDCGGRWVGE